jgi:hypothetical protein
MKSIVSFGFVLLLSASASAQTALLVDNTSVLPGDSPLVAAAKRSLAARRGTLAAQNGWVIDDSMVRHRLLVDAAPAPPLRTASTPGSTAPPSTFSSNDGTAARQQLQKQRTALQREMQILAEENDQPYGGDISEDRVVQRLTQIPAEVQAIERKSAQPPLP